MAYLGNDLQVAYQSYQIIDDISGSFNGSLTTFPLQVGGITPVPFPINPQQCLISVNGVIQEPDPSGTSGFNLVGSNIEFSSAPTGGHAFFGVILAGADYVNVGASFPDGSEANPSLTFDQDLDTGLYRGGFGITSVTANGNRIADFGPAAVVFNEDGDNIDFRVEGDTITNLLEVDASRDTVVIGGDLEPATINSLAYPTAGALSNRNKIINGAMQVDQRNNGGSVNTNGAFPVDRFYQRAVGTGAITSQRSTTAPAGFTNSLQATVSTADASLTSTDEYFLVQHIEGFNVSDFDFGLPSAKTITVSFWVRSSLTGSFGFALKNSTITRSYPTSYTINIANTWEYKTITIPGDTAGMWLKDSGRGLECHWSLGAASGFKTTGNAWAGGYYNSATGTVNWISTLGATFFLTGVQVELGTVATPFERRSYGQELMLCQRYFHKTRSIFRTYQAAGEFLYPYTLPVVMRAQPTVTLLSTAGSSGPSSIAVYGNSYDGANINVGVTTAGTGFAYAVSEFTVSAEL